MTTSLFTREGERALGDLARRRSALVFDLDGTLAPLVRRPAEARVPASTVAHLCEVASRWPIAVVTGRSVSDATERLGFEPHALFGNHGAQRRGGTACSQSLVFERALDGARAGLRRCATEMRKLGIDLEDKAFSLALHYRGSSNAAAARRYCHDLLQAHSRGLRVEDGHCVVNLMAADAPDKGDALRELLAEWALDCALVVGDDRNDEAAFAAAPAGSVSVRIGAVGQPTAAAFTLEHQTEVDALLDLLRRLRPAGFRPT